jgi:hypothetical protein
MPKFPSATCLRLGAAFAPPGSLSSPRSRGGRVNSRLLRKVEASRTSVSNDRRLARVFSKGLVEDYVSIDAVTRCDAQPPSVRFLLVSPVDLRVNS